MTTKTTLLSVFLFALLFISCTNNEPQFRIGVSQCSEDVWRDRLVMEMRNATNFYDNVELCVAYAGDNDRVQADQIDSLVDSGIDLLVASPNSMEALEPNIQRAFDKGIPVILFDRKAGNSEKYTAFMGADNYRIGEMAGHFVANRLGGKGNIVTVGGLKESSPAKDRHRGFMNVIKEHPDLHVVGYDNGDWTQHSGEEVMRKLLKQGMPKIDCIFGENDRMALGAYNFLKTTGHGEDVIVIGVDALPDRGCGMELVRDGTFTGSVIYPTHGDELLALALDILEGRPYQRENLMETAIVTSGNASELLMQNREMVRQSQNLDLMTSRVNRVQMQYREQKMVLALFIVLTLFIAALLALSIRAYHQKNVINARLADEKKKVEEQRDEISQQKEIVERQRDELEQQRDQLIEAAIQTEGDTPDTGSDVLTGQEEQYQEENEFMLRFYSVVESHLSDSDLSVEVIGQEIGYSRVQLYRKVKALTGKSPVELVRNMRLERARQLLKDSSLSVSEIAYRVGFSSPSYFSKCFKDEFGISPTNS